MAKKAKDIGINFTQSLKRLEEIVIMLEAPHLELEKSLELLEEGAKLHKLCKAKLTEANVKLTTILKKDYAEGTKINEGGEQNG